MFSLMHVILGTPWEARRSRSCRSTWSRRSQGRGWCYGIPRPQRRKRRHGSIWITCEWQCWAHNTAHHMTARKVLVLTVAFLCEIHSLRRDIKNDTEVPFSIAVVGRQNWPSDDRPIFFYLLLCDITSRAAGDGRQTGPNCTLDQQHNFLIAA